MAPVMLGEFIQTNRVELLRRCKEKVAQRADPPSTNGDAQSGIPVFLDQLSEELSTAGSQTRAIRESAGHHGKVLFHDGFNIAQVVHDYGDVCQSITDLAVETAAPIATDDFRTLNRCLDDAIAGAVSEFSQHHRNHKADQALDQSLQLRNLLYTAITGFEALQTGTVGVSGTTGTMVYKTLVAMRALV